MKLLVVIGKSLLWAAAVLAALFVVLVTWELGAPCAWSLLRRFGDWLEEA